MEYKVYCIILQDCINIMGLYMKDPDGMEHIRALDKLRERYDHCEFVRGMWQVMNNEFNNLDQEREEVETDGILKN